jgi:CheY-like chemotaxis protein
VATIVIVEDEPATLRLLAALLGAKGHRVVPLPDGSALADTVRAERPALVLLDLQLPGKDGFTLLGELRGGADTAATRVVALTASSGESDREQVAAAGFDGFVAKPISPASFAGEIAQLLG